MTDKVIQLSFDTLHDELGYASVTDYCRDLVKTRDNLDGVRIELFRGEMLCLTVNDIKYAATMQPTGRGWTKYDKRRNRGSVEAP